MLILVLDSSYYINYDCNNFDCFVDSQGRYGEPAVRRAVPLAIALCSISNPQLAVIDVLNKYSHDSDNDVAYNAIFAMGLVGAGTNNAR